MHIQLLSTTEEFAEYDAWIQQSDVGNFWQSLERKTYLERLGKDVRIYALKDGAHMRATALVVIDTTAFGLSTWEIPRGPVREMRDEIRDRRCEELMEYIVVEAKSEGCMVVYFSAQQRLAVGSSQFAVRSSPRHIHCEATRIIDLKMSEEEILAQMKPKGRYNIKVAQKNGVTVKRSTDSDAFYALVQHTSKRDNFTSLSRQQYAAFLHNIPGAFLLLAYGDDKQTQPIAGVMSVIWNNQAIYYYGASNHAERAKMAPYLLQWESIRYAKEQGCHRYDLLGIAPPDSNDTHPWAGISSFKEKFGGDIVEYPKEQMIVLRPIRYWLVKMKRRIMG